MNVQVEPRATMAGRRVPFECVALVLQGGGALGAYQAGVYEALAEAGIYPDWVAGISIGAINCALIAGNPPEARVDRLREFWEGITNRSNGWSEWTNAAKGDAARLWLNRWHASLAMLAGTPGFFAPRHLPPWLYPSGSAHATSLYDTSRLSATLERLVDFDRLNAGAIRLSVGAVNVRSGNFVYFDTQTRTIGPEHIMASGALPPGFPAVEIEGEHYWGGGLVSNTPLQWIVESQPRLDTLAFQVDLWSALGELPRSLAEVSTRQKEIQFSSRTRASTDSFKRIQRLRRATADLLDQLPDELSRSPEAAMLRHAADRMVYNIVHLIYRAKNYEGPAKDYEFSRESMADHWHAGYHDAVRTLRHREVTNHRPITKASLRSTSPQMDANRGRLRDSAMGNQTESKMHETQSGKFDLNEKSVALLLGEFDHRMRNLLTMIEAMVRQTQSTSIEGYRAKLIARITGLSGFYQLASSYGRTLGLAELIDQTVRPYSAYGAQVLTAGPDLELEPSLAFALHLVFHELATNAKKYGALSSPFGRVKIEWKFRHDPRARRKLAVVYTEEGGPEVKAPQHRGFGSRLIKTALGGYGGVWLDFNSMGLACFMLIDLDR